MSKPYTVKRGDTLNSIAKTYGLKSWRELYMSLDNGAFRRKRPNPNLIMAGDILMVPGSATGNFDYTVGGSAVVIKQPTSLICWATVYTMMISWKQAKSFAIRDAAASVDPKYGALVDANKALPTNEFAPFLQAAKMQHQPMVNLPPQQWLNLLKQKGLLWVGSLGAVSPGRYLHSRILEGMYGDGDPTTTWMRIIDPESGTRYDEQFAVFLSRYEGGLGMSSGQYFQVRYY